MKRRNGILVFFALLFLLPLVADFVLYLLLKKSLINWNMSAIMFSSYARMLPWFILYLIIAFTILYQIKQTRKNRSKRK